ELLARRELDLDGGPVWLRDHSDGSSSGIGSIQVTEPEEAHAWAYLNPGIPSYMVAEHLPGRNIAWPPPFHEDRLPPARSHPAPACPLACSSGRRPRRSAPPVAAARITPPRP